MTLDGSVPRGKSRALTATLPAVQAIAQLGKLRPADTGTVPDNFGTTALVHGHVRLKPAKPHKKHKH